MNTAVRGITLRQFHTGHPIGLDHQPRDLTANDTDRTGFQSGFFG